MASAEIPVEDFFHRPRLTDVAISPGGRHLAAIVPGAEGFVIAGRDHMKAVGDRSYKARVLAFLDRVRGGAGG